MNERGLSKKFVFAFLFVIVLSSGFVSASFFGDLWNKLAGDSSNTITGDSIYYEDSFSYSDLKLGIPLTEGWNYFYWPSDAPQVSVEEGFASIDDFYYAYDSSANEYNFNPTQKYASQSTKPVYRTRLFDKLRPGIKYQVFMPRDEVLQYPVGGGMGNITNYTSDLGLYSNYSVGSSSCNDASEFCSDTQISNSAKVPSSEKDAWCKSRFLSSSSFCYSCNKGYSWNGNSCAQIVSSDKNVTTCTDSDGGMNYYVKGIMVDKTGKIYSDKCTNDTELVEYSCDLGTGMMGSFKCANGCKEGACIRESRVDCTDSDGGLFSLEKGVVQDKNGEVFLDKCVVESGEELYYSQIKEAFCGEEGEVEYVTLSCPEGWSCFVDDELGASCTEGFYYFEISSGPGYTLVSSDGKTFDFSFSSDYDGGNFGFCGDKIEMSVDGESLELDLWGRNRYKSEGVDFVISACYQDTLSFVFLEGGLIRSSSGGSESIIGPGQEQLAIAAVNCEGCFSSGNCYEVGERHEGNYCAEAKLMMDQSKLGATCENDFECETNICQNKKCASSRSVFEKIQNAVRNLFSSLF